MKKAHDKAVHDYAFHLHLSPNLGSAQLEEMGQLIRERRPTSFKLFMATPASSCSMDATIFRAMRQAAKTAAFCMQRKMAAPRPTSSVQQALAEGKRAPKYHALTRPTHRRS